jgi:hypothetical protein
MMGVRTGLLPQVVSCFIKVYPKTTVLKSVRSANRSIFRGEQAAIDIVEQLIPVC